MKCSEVIEKIEAAFPVKYALSWDNVGLLAGDEMTEVHKVYLALDVTDDVIDEAIKEGADMIISHHPMIFTPMKKIVASDFIGRRLLKMIAHGICYYAMHTNYDVIGMGAAAANMLGLAKTTPLEVTCDEEPLKGIGSVGEMAPVTLLELAEIVKSVFDIESVRIFGDLEATVTRVAMCPGSGKGMDVEALKMGAEVLITGDIGHHDGLDSVAKGLYIIDAGHQGIEHIFIKNMASFIEEKCPELACVCEDSKSPFIVV